MQVVSQTENQGGGGIDIPYAFCILLKMNAPRFQNKLSRSYLKNTTD